MYRTGARLNRTETYRKGTRKPHGGAERRWNESMKAVGFRDTRSFRKEDGLVLKGGRMMIFLFLLSLSLAPISAQDYAGPVQDVREVTATGLGSIVGGDVAHARDDAITDALRTGVEQAVGLMVESETLVENFQLIEDRIFSRSKGYIKNYQVMSEGKRAEDLYEVTLQAVVSMAVLKDDLEGIATLMRRVNTPRIMVMIDERNIGESPGYLHYIDADMNTAENAITDALMKKGFKFVDQATVKQNLKQEQASAILQGDTKQAAAIGKMVNAEVVITGKALAKATEVEAFGAKTRSQQASVTVKAIRTDTGDIIATAEGQGAYPHIDDIVGGTKAIQKACEKISGELIDKILNRWQADVNEGTTISLRVKGVTGFDQLNQFTSALPSSVRGLVSVLQREWVEGYALLDVTMKGNSTDLARRLSNATFGNIKVKVTGMSQNSVSVELISSE